MSEFEPHGIAIHPAANIFPMMDDAAYAGLLADIRANGVKTHLQFRGNSLASAELLDGRNRLKAIIELGMSWKTYAELSTPEEIPDPVVYVLSLNLHRRHLSESQRAMVAAKIANLQNGSNQYGSKVGGADAPPTPPISQTAAGEMLNVSRDSVKRGVKVERQGTEELQQAVVSGAMKVTTAARIAELPKPEQAAAIAQAKTPKRPAGEELEVVTPPVQLQEQQPRKSKKTSVGIERAHEAIACLKRIPNGDERGERAYQLVADWIKNNPFRS